MPAEYRPAFWKVHIATLKIAAYVAYLAAWVMFAVAALMGALPRLGRASGGFAMPVPVVAGTLLQLAAAFLLTASMDSGPLHAGTIELTGALVLAPLGAALFTWAICSSQRQQDGTLVTEGAYRWLRHPIYLAFLAMLGATGLILSSGAKLALPVLLYLAGTELRIATEERELAAKFGDRYAEYRRRTRWRYFPGLR